MKNVFISHLRITFPILSETLSMRARKQPISSFCVSRMKISTTTIYNTLDILYHCIRYCEYFHASELNIFENRPGKSILSYVGLRLIVCPRTPIW